MIKIVFIITHIIIIIIIIILIIIIITRLVNVLNIQYLIETHIHIIIHNNNNNNDQSPKSIENNGQPRVVSAAVRVTFDYKHDVINNKNIHIHSHYIDDHWEWSKQIFIPNSMSRGRRHVMVNNHLYGYEDLISFVTLLHRSVVHTIFFRCGQPPVLIRNETSHILIFSQPTNDDNDKHKREHKIAPYQASAFDWRSELPDKLSDEMMQQQQQQQQQQNGDTKNKKHKSKSKSKRKKKK
eukprot:400735_1